MDHPHILKLYDHFEDESSIYLVLHYCKLGQLYDKTQKEGAIEEKDVAKYIR